MSSSLPKGHLLKVHTHSKMSILEPSCYSPLLSPPPELKNFSHVQSCALCKSSSFQQKVGAGAERHLFRQWRQKKELIQKGTGKD